MNEIKYSAYLWKTSSVWTFMSLRNSAVTIQDTLNDCHPLILQGRVARCTTRCFHTSYLDMHRIHPRKFVSKRSDEVPWDEKGAVNSIVASTFATHPNQFAF